MVIGTVVFQNGSCYVGRAAASERTAGDRRGPSPEEYGGNLYVSSSTTGSPEAAIKRLQAFGQRKIGLERYLRYSKRSGSASGKSVH